MPLPEIQPLAPQALTLPAQTVFENEIKVYTIEGGTQPVIGITWLFPLGNSTVPTPLLNGYGFAMLQEGTSQKPQSVIAETLDHYGATLRFVPGNTYSSVQLYCLSAYAVELIAFVYDLFYDATFPLASLERLQRNSISQLKVNEKKVAWNARTLFSELLWGKGHAYVQHESEESIQSLTVDQLKEWHQSLFVPTKPTIMVVGKSTKTAISALEAHFSSRIFKNDSALVYPSAKGEKPGFYEKTIADALQNAIRLGFLTIGPQHQDFIGLQIANTVLGGYFGSRLMKNIREDKGYTYGIGSGLIAFGPERALWVIQTEVGADFTADTITQIQHEIATLRTQLIPEEELLLVKNYMLGNLLSDYDGAFAVMERFKETYMLAQGDAYFEQQFKRIQNITSTELLALFQHYLLPDNLISVVSGRKMN